MFDKKLLEGKVALVTGASRGIGHGIAVALARHGAHVIGTATTKEGAAHFLQALQSQSLSGAGMVLDVTSSASILAVIDKIKTNFGAVSILVNNAAITQDNLFLRMKDEEWFRVIETDLNSIYRLSKACIKDMLKARWGRIINIGSVVGDIGNPGQTNYCAAKAGIVGFSKALALEVGSRNITVNTIAPGFIATDMTNVLSAEQQAVIFQRIPVKRLGSVDDITATVLFLASPGAGYMTGQTIHVNGGMYMN